MDKIVIVEDDVLLREEMQNILEKQGYVVECITTFNHSIDDIISAAPSLIILDLNLPNLSGFEICRRVKAKGIGPIVVLTSRNQLNDELHALDLGADDYLTKPCHPRRLIARVQKLLTIYSTISPILDAGDFKIEELSNRLLVGKKSIILSDNEGIIMKELVKSSPSIVNKEKLFQLLWGSSQFVDENILQVNMTRLRKTLEEVGLAHRIKTKRGIGYYLEGDDSQ